MIFNARFLMDKINPLAYICFSLAKKGSLSMFNLIESLVPVQLYWPQPMLLPFHIFGDSILLCASIHPFFSIILSIKRNSDRFKN